MKYIKLHTMPPFSYMSIFLNKQVLLTATLFSPLTLLIEQIGQDGFYMIFVLLLFVAIDTMLGVYIAWENRVLKSGKDGYGKIVDKLISYFGLIVLTYSIVILAYTVPLYTIGGVSMPIDTILLIKYFVAFSFSVMYGREIMSIFESIDKLQPSLLPKPLKRFINKMFKRELNK